MSFPQGVLPILPLRNTVIFPGLSQIVRVGRERSVNALLKAEKLGFWIVTSQQIQMTDQRSSTDSSVEPSDIHRVGTICRIDSQKGNAESGYQVVLRGVARVSLEQIELDQDLYLKAVVSELTDESDVDANTRSVLLASLKEVAQSILKLIPANTEQLVELLASVDDLSFLCALCAGNIDLPAKEKQKILEMRSLKERSLYLLNTLTQLKESLSVQAEIRGKLNQKLGQSQRQAILREQLKAIREELGESDEVSKEDQLKDKIEKAQMPEEAKKIALNELKRLSEVGTQSPESHIIRNYLELLTSLPWAQQSSEEEIDLTKAKKILDEDHYGLESVKKRIIQHLAVLKLKKDLKGSILLLVGPPGVGKTSMGESIAKVLNKKFVRVSVGGTRDDAEIRGHRRTYIGAMPGRIIQGIKRSAVNNPVFLLDEIDKLSRSFQGDPGAALLEVLDPEQNSTFLDHYLDVSFDLSKVFFIATANSLESIPTPLLDRMEVIEINGYTMAEKMHIAKKHLIPKQLKAHGVTEADWNLSDEALSRLITSYTREAGVRELQRKIVNLIRASSEKLIDTNLKPVKIEIAQLEELLGREKFQIEIAESFAAPGVATGLAWTPVGGDILFIESSKMPGKGEITITGQLGEVMRESAQISLSLARTLLAQTGFVLDKSTTDIHIHVPAGAIQKDGPSAGVTMLTSLASLLSNLPVRPKLAMTGEITLRGAVLPVGGIKEKIIAAHRAGVEEVILPLRNEKDLSEVPAEIRTALKIYFVDRVEKVLELALGLKTEPFRSLEAVKSSLPKTEKHI